MNTKELLESLSRLIGVVVRDLGGDVVRNVGGGDLVKELKKERKGKVSEKGTRSLKFERFGTDQSSDPSEARPVDGSESSSRESPDGVAVVRDERIGVLRKKEEKSQRRTSVRFLPLFAECKVKLTWMNTIPTSQWFT